ncbi:MAG: hypothetical protein LBG77_07150 [Dysgonamonadaceae bacterium]|jgi:hypothetical protein|nr:hypothetical protein [Dysgonamonadaceae bacterium]
MKKILQLAIFLMVLGLLSVDAQVHIGSTENPHDGSILDLSNAGSLGMLLPRVPLGDADVFQLSGDAAAATGMVVYNTNATMTNGYGAGVYVWDGAKWNIVGQDAIYKPYLNGVSCVDVSPGQNDPGLTEYMALDNGTGIVNIDNVTWTITESIQGLIDSYSSTGISQPLILNSRSALSALAATADQTITIVADIKYSDGKIVQLSATVKIQNRSC